MKRLTLALLLILPFTSFAAEPERTSIILRMHHRATDRGGRSFEWTDLVFRGDVDGMVTLWKSAAGERFIFRESEVYARRLTSYSIANLDTKEFLYGSYPLQYGGTTIAEAKANREKLPPESFAGVPFTIATHEFHATAPIEKWHIPAGEGIRAELRRHLAPEFIRAFRDNVVSAAQSGSPGARAACDHLLDVIADGAVCARDRQAVIETTGEDCAFDAQYGYPCQAE